MRTLDVDKTKEAPRGSVIQELENPAWISKVVGDTQVYTKGDANISYAVNVLKSVRWPGASTVSKGGKFTNIYVGYGIKRVDPSYNPTSPPIIDSEPIDSIE